MVFRKCWDFLWVFLFLFLFSVHYFGLAYDPEISFFALKSKKEKVLDRGQKDF